MKADLDNKVIRIINNYNMTNEIDLHFYYYTVPDEYIGPRETVFTDKLLNIYFLILKVENS